MILEIDPKTNEIVWEYNDRKNLFYSPVCSGAQRLPNGNTFICESTKGRFFEITPDGEIVWEYINPFFTKHPPFWKYDWMTTRETFRATRYAPDFSGFKGKDLSPDKYEWTIQKKRQKSSKEVEEEETYGRLKKLGY